MLWKSESVKWGALWHFEHLPRPKNTSMPLFWATVRALSSPCTQRSKGESNEFTVRS